MYAVVEKVTKS